jgi:YfiH family protein
MTTWTSPRSSVDVTSGSSVLEVALGDGVEAWFTGASIDGLTDANLAHHLPHDPDRLGQARDRVAVMTGTDVTSWHLMRQVHGAAVAVIDDGTPHGAESRDVDILVTELRDRPLVVLGADCLPILAAGRRAIGAAHAGWRGIVAGVPDVLVSALRDLGEHPEDLTVVMGPAIGPCCYEVGPEVVTQIADVCAEAVARTRSGQAAVDLRLAARHRFVERGVREVRDIGVGEDGAPACTACDARWFSHRRDPRSGRQAGIIVRRALGHARRLP